MRSENTPSRYEDKLTPWSQIMQHSLHPTFKRRPNLYQTQEGTQVSLNFFNLNFIFLPRIASFFTRPSQVVRLFLLTDSGFLFCSFRTEISFHKIFQNFTCWSCKTFVIVNIYLIIHWHNWPASWSE